MFQILRITNFIIKLKKYNFMKQELRFLRYIIFKDGIRVDSEKIVKMISLLLLNNLKQL